jgi:mRNA interferase MazF
MVSAGDIILIDFPFTVPAQSKVRPALVITLTEDRFHDIVACAISSVLPERSSSRDIVLSKDNPHFPQTGLRASSVIKVDRITTLRQSDVITTIGRCPAEEWKTFITIFRSLVS